MATFNALVTALGVDLRDPAAKTFSAAVLGEFINEAVMEVSRIAPEQFIQSITVTADTPSYTVKAGHAATRAKRVEVWDKATPSAYVAFLRPAASEIHRSSSVGWELWNGTLYLTSSTLAWLDPALHVLRVWGYAPYAIVSGTTEMPMSDDLEYAVRVYARVLGIESLINARNLFTQWQALSNNTDATPASLQAHLSLARTNWERLRRQIVLLRENS